MRKEKYELPPEAIREMIINAHCHRNILDESCIQVAPSLIFLNTKSTVSYICVYIGPVNSRLSKNTAGPVPLNTAHCVLENGKYPDVSNA